MKPWTVRTLARELASWQEALTHEVAGPLEFFLDWRGELRTRVDADHDLEVCEPITAGELVGWPGFDAMRSARRLLARWRDMRADRQLELFK